VAAATEQTEKVIQLTHDLYVQAEARDPKERIYGPRSWKRADGKKKARICEHAVTGVVVVGPGRGEAFRVCIAKEKCAVHWAAEQKERKRRADAAARGVPTGPRSAQTTWQREQAKRDAERKQQEAENLRWT